MKYKTLLVILATCLASATGVHAQTVLTDFSSSADLGPSVNLVGSGGAFAVSSGALNYTVADPGDSEFTYITYTGAVGSYTSDWSVQVSVNYAAPASIFDSGVEQAINAGLMVTKTGASLGTTGSGPTFDAFLVNSNLYWDGSNGSRDIRSSVFVANAEPVDEETRYAGGAVSSGSFSVVIISFNSTTKVLTASYDLDGAGGASPVVMNTAPDDSVDTSTWNMTSGDSFSIHLVGNALYDGNASGLGPIIGTGEVSFDNLAGTGLTAVPEPSTYAALAGVLALGLAAWRRRAHSGR